MELYQLPTTNKSARTKTTSIEGLTIVSYNVGDPNLWKQPFGVECRGSVFETETGRCLARPFEKFFNLGETEETSYERIRQYWDDKESTIDVVEKLDGSMVHPVLLPDGSVRWKTKNCFNSDDAKLAEEEFAEVGNSTALQMLLHAGVTPIFELTGPDNLIVLPYAEQKLTLLAIRRISDGSYWPHSVVGGVARELGVDWLQKPVSRSRFNSFDEFVEHVRAMTGVEGMILIINDTLRVKIKCQWYLNRHRLIAIRERDVADFVASGEIDDMMDELRTAEADMDAVQDIITRVINDMWAIQNQINHVVDCIKQMPNPSRREVYELAAMLSKNLYKGVLNAAMATIDDKSVNMNGIWKTNFRNNYSLRSISNSRFGG